MMKYQLLFSTPFFFSNIFIDIPFFFAFFRGGSCLSASCYLSLLWPFLLPTPFSQTLSALLLSPISRSYTLTIGLWISTQQQEASKQEQSSKDHKGVCRMHSSALMWYYQMAKYIFHAVDEKLLLLSLEKGR